MLVPTMTVAESVALGQPSTRGLRLDLGASLIILDEPTAVLTPQEVANLFVTLGRMVAEGHSLLFISHKLHKVLEVSDRGHARGHGGHD